MHNSNLRGQLLKKNSQNVVSRKDYAFKGFNFPQILKLIIMKKILFLFSLFMILSCSSSDDSASSSDFNPPSWIQGTWKEENDIGLGLKFSTNNVIIINPTIETSLQGLVDSARNAGQTTSVDETISNTSYSVKMNFYGGGSTIYTFKKTSTNTIVWSQITGLDIVYIKQ